MKNCKIVVAYILIVLLALILLALWPIKTILNKIFIKIDDAINFLLDRELQYGNKTTFDIYGEYHTSPFDCPKRKENRDS